MLLPITSMATWWLRKPLMLEYSERSIARLLLSAISAWCE
jgi:hypothetical protein